MTIEQSFPQALAGIADGFQIMDLVSRNVVWLVRGGQARAGLKVQKGRKVSLKRMPFAQRLDNGSAHFPESRVREISISPAPMDAKQSLLAQ